MSASIYSDKQVQPGTDLFSKDLSHTRDYYDKICEFIENEYGVLIREWKYYGKKSGWILKLINIKRNVLFIIPCNNYFRTAFTFGDKATDIVLNSELSDSIKKEITNAKKYAEGRTIQIEVRNEDDLNVVIELIKIKLLR